MFHVMLMNFDQCCLLLMGLFHFFHISFSFRSNHRIIVNVTVSLANVAFFQSLSQFSLFQNCGPALAKHYGRQMKKLVGCIQRDLLNVLDEELQVGSFRFSLFKFK